MRITNRLAELRDRAGKTQNQVVDELTGRLGHRPFTRQMLSHWECGRHQPSGEELAILCDYYHVQPGDVLVLGEPASALAVAS